jgi:hypothetical protein
MGQRSGRVTTWVERAALGAIMTVVAVVVERRLLKALRRRGEEPRPATTSDAELSAAPQDVDH